MQIIATIVHEPKLIILDEPFSGFDPINGQLLQSLIERLREKGCTVILSSHNMPAIEQMCTHIGLINKGQLLLHGPLQEIRESHRTGLLSLTTSSELNRGMAADSGLIESIEEVQDNLRAGAHTYHIMPKHGVSNNDILATIAIQADILAFSEVMPTLSDLFIQYTQGQTTN